MTDEYAYLIAIHDAETHKLAGAEVWSDPPWQQSIQTNARWWYVAYSVKHDTYHEAKELLLDVISHPQSLWRYLYDMLDDPKQE